MIRKTSDLIKYRIEAFKTISSLVNKLKQNNFNLLKFKTQTDEPSIDQNKCLMYNEISIIMNDKLLYF